jgi:hypothetical protein
MAAVGIDQIEVKYIYGGDSIDEILFNPPTPIGNGIKEYFGDELCDPIYKFHGRFADDGGLHVNGSVFYNSVNKIIWLTGTNYKYVEGETTKWSCEDWEEEPEYTPELYQYDYDFNSRISSTVSFDFVFLYARDFLKNQLPEELHNFLLMEAANGDENAINYIKLFSQAINGKLR